MPHHPADVKQVTMEFPMTLEGRMTTLRWVRPKRDSLELEHFLVVAVTEPEAWRRYELLNEDYDKAI